MIFAPSSLARPSRLSSCSEWPWISAALKPQRHAGQPYARGVISPSCAACSSAGSQAGAKTSAPARNQLWPPDRGAPALRVAADAPSYLRLLRGEEDADRLFFERALVMEGDTEYGLVLKNTLDAIGPLLEWPTLKRQVDR